MSNIRIDYDGLAQQSATLKNCASTYAGLCDRMRTLSGQIGESWDGDAANAFTEMMEKYYRQGTILTEVIGTIQGYADTTSSQFQSVDQECSALIRNSF